MDAKLEAYLLTVLSGYVRCIGYVHGRFSGAGVQWRGEGVKGWGCVRISLCPYHDLRMMFAALPAQLEKLAGWFLPGAWVNELKQLCNWEIFWGNMSSLSGNFLCSEMLSPKLWKRLGKQHTIRAEQFVLTINHLRQEYRDNSRMMAFPLHWCNSLHTGTLDDGVFLTTAWAIFLTSHSEIHDLWL